MRLTLSCFAGFLIAIPMAMAADNGVQVTSVCYSRTYDSEHLANPTHKTQSLKSISVQLTTMASGGSKWKFAAVKGIPVTPQAAGLEGAQYTFLGNVALGKQTFCASSDGDGDSFNGCAVIDTTTTPKVAYVKPAAIKYNSATVDAPSPAIVQSNGIDLIYCDAGLGGHETDGEGCVPSVAVRTIRLSPSFTDDHSEDGLYKLDQVPCPTAQ
jgi:hypothetical protein